MADHTIPARINNIFAAGFLTRFEIELNSAVSLQKRLLEGTPAQHGAFQPLGELPHPREGRVVPEWVEIDRRAAGDDVVDG